MSDFGEFHELIPLNFGLRRCLPELCYFDLEIIEVGGLWFLIGLHFHLKRLKLFFFAFFLLILHHLFDNNGEFGKGCFLLLPQYFVFGGGACWVEIGGLQGLNGHVHVVANKYLRSLYIIGGYSRECFILFHRWIKWKNPNNNNYRLSGFIYPPWTPMSKSWSSGSKVWPMVNLTTSTNFPPSPNPTNAISVSYLQTRSIIASLISPTSSSRRIFPTISPCRVSFWAGRARKWWFPHPSDSASKWSTLKRCKK